MPSVPVAASAGVRDDVIKSVAASIVALEPGRVAMVGIDGVDGSGKTVFADQLADVVARLGRPVVRAGVDDFHHPRQVRWRRGRHNPEAFFEDTFDYATLRAVLLDPFAANAEFCRAVFDHVAHRPIERRLERAPADAVLVFDGIFVHRDELVGYWDYSVFLQVGFDVSVPRMARRDGGNPSLAANQRWVLGQQRYFDACAPRTRASVVIDNTDFDDPRFLAR